MYSLEGNSNENTTHTFMLKKIEKIIPIMPRDLALLLTLISSNYPCLEHIFMVPAIRAIDVRLYISSSSPRNICQLNKP